MPITGYQQRMTTEQNTPDSPAVGIPVHWRVGPGAEACPACGSDCNERNQLDNAARDIEQLRYELGQLSHQFARAVKLADDRLQQMKADRAQALRWRDALDLALTVCRCAARVVDSSAYQGVSDEDCDLENAVRNWHAAFDSKLDTSALVT